MKKLLLSSLAVLSIGAVLAAAPKGGKSEPVCAAFPDWQGLSEKNKVWGRDLTPSDLRHKITVVIEFEKGGEGLQSLFPVLNQAMNLVPAIDHSIDWLTAEDLPRDVVIVFCNRGSAKEHETIMEAFKYKGDEQSMTAAIQAVRSNSSCYDGVGFTGSPDTTGKRPYMYVMGPTGKEPLFQGEVNPANVKAIVAAGKKAKGAMHADGANWEPNYGMLPEESKYRKMIKDAIDKPIDKVKPLKPVADKILKDVSSKDEAVAAEAQMAYDALIQARSELVNRIMLEYRASPPRARCDMDLLFKLWPSEKKKFEKALAFMKTLPEADQLYKMLKQLTVWSKPDFAPKNASDAKKIVAELGKMKKILEKLKESKNITVQNAALVMDGQIDELTGTIPSLVPSK